jgi:hypothetical protein
VTVTLPADRFQADTITMLGAAATGAAAAVIGHVDSYSTALALEVAVFFLATLRPFQPPPLHPSNGAPPP